MVGGPEYVHSTVAILARDEERCIARCLDSVVRRGFDDIVVVDTGSVDDTPQIVEKYRDLGVRLLLAPWHGSFAHARNTAIDAAEPGWIVFVDADEWLPGDSADRLPSCLRSLSTLPGLSRRAFAPRIVDVYQRSHTDEVPRIFRTDGRIRYKGAVHEYPVVDDGTPVDLARLDIEFRHDGYEPAVLDAKNKARRNLDLLTLARAEDPDNPRWLYFTLRNPLSVTEDLPIAGLCDAIGELAGKALRTGDRRSAAEYHRLALALACQGLALRGDWPTIDRFCAELDRHDGGESPDATYFRLLSQLLHGSATTDGLRHAVTVRRREDTLAKSTLCPSGRHLDAIIAAFMSHWKTEETANQYRVICEPWTDVFFDRSHLRGHFRL